MERLRAKLTFIGEHLGKLTPTHKMLIGSALVVMVMGLFLVSQYTGRAEMVPIEVGTEVKADAVRFLKTNGINAESTPDGLLVPAERQFEAMAVLGEKRVLGEDTSSMLLELIQGQPWWANRQQNHEAKNAAMGQVLAKVLGEWSYIRRADVIVSSSANRPGLGQQRVEPKASVSIYPRSGELSPAEVEAIADFVSGAVPSLDPDQVRIIDMKRGHSLRVPSQDELESGTYMEILAKVESYWEDKIRRLFPDIPQFVVIVNAQIDHAPKVRSELSYKKEGQGSEVFMTEETDHNSSESGMTQGANPGARAMTGTNIPTGSTNSTPGSSMKDSSATYAPNPGRIEETSTIPGGKPTKINAAVRVPRSYFTRIWNALNPDATDEPDDAALAPIVSKELGLIQSQIEVLIDTENEADAAGGAPTSATRGKVEVAVRHDFDDAPLGPGQDGAFNAGPSSWLVNGPSEMIGVGWRDIGLSVLSVVSLFLMFRLVRSGTSNRNLPSAEELVGIPPSLHAGHEELIGQADDSEPAMDAYEVNEDEVLTQSLVDQVDSLVGENPAEAAKLIKRWVSAED
jgi:flagellar biosynthesis/type III secretory pathway M-ring protein FliF/YscJ